jgi:hypothetical protein
MEYVEETSQGVAVPTITTPRRGTWKSTPRAPRGPSVYTRHSSGTTQVIMTSQFLTNHGCFHSYLYKRKRAPSPLRSCPEKEEKTALHLLKDCSLLTKVRPPPFQTLTLPQIMQHHINTADLSSLINSHLPHATGTVDK